MKQLLLCSMAFILAIKLDAQVFTIENGTGSVSYPAVTASNSNFAMAYMLDSGSINKAYVQFVGTDQVLTTRTEVTTGKMSSLEICFGANRYLLAWVDSNGLVVGRFMTTDGQFSGNAFTIANDANSEDLEKPVVVYGDSSFLVLYKHNNGLPTKRGRLAYRGVHANGTLIGSSAQLSYVNARDIAAAFDQSKFVVAYVHDTSDNTPSDSDDFNDLYLQKIDASFAPIGSPVLHKSGLFQRDNPVSMVYAAKRFVMTYHEQVNTWHKWNLYAEWLDTSLQVVNNTRIADTLTDPMIPVVSYGNQKFLITWTSNRGTRIKAQYFDSSGLSTSQPITLFDSVPNTIYISNNTFTNNHFLVLVAQLDYNFEGGNLKGYMIPATGNLSTKELSTNKTAVNVYPNPSSGSLYLHIEKPNPSMQINLYNSLGEMVLQKTITSQLTEINTNQLPTGIYFYTIISENNSVSHYGRWMKTE